MNNEKKIRLNFPIWLGGNNPVYKLGSDLLDFLAPKTEMEIIDIPVHENTIGVRIEDGMTERSKVMTEFDTVSDVLSSKQPDKIIIFGGDCSCDFIPFAYLADKYKDDYGILWIDAHPDIQTTEHYPNVHAHVLGALMGKGQDTDLLSRVPYYISPKKVMIAGSHSHSEYEKSFLQKHQVNLCSPEVVMDGTDSLVKWIKDNGIKHLAIHLDLDVLNEKKFKPLYLNNPNKNESDFDGIPRGKLDVEHVIKWVDAANKNANVVGFGIAEHLPWEAMMMKELLNSLSIIK